MVTSLIHYGIVALLKMKRWYEGQSGKLDCLVIFDEKFWFYDVINIEQSAYLKTDPRHQIV